MLSLFFRSFNFFIIGSIFVFDYIYLEIWCIQVDNAIRVYGALALAVCFVEFQT